LGKASWGKFTGLCTSAADLNDSGNERSMTIVPTVPLQLEYVLTGVGMRRGKEDCESRVDGVLMGIEKASEGCAPRRW